MPDLLSCRLIFGLLMAFMAATGVGRAQTNVVVVDDLGNFSNHPRLLTGNNYTWPSSVPAGVTGRTVAFGATVTLGYGSANPAATYQAVIVLSSDNTNRTALISVDGQQIGGIVSTSANSQIRVTVAIPSSAVADGTFQLSVANKGATSPNAAVGNVTIFSTTTAALISTTTTFDPSSVQYTPIPIPTGVDPGWSSLDEDRDGLPLLIEFLTHRDPMRVDANPIQLGAGEALLDLRNLTSTGGIREAV